jgi:hypothetical protein
VNILNYTIQISIGATISDTTLPDITETHSCHKQATRGGTLTALIQTTINRTSHAQKINDTQAVFSKCLWRYIICHVPEEYIPELHNPTFFVACNWCVTSDFKIQLHHVLKLFKQMKLPCSGWIRPKETLSYIQQSVVLTNGKGPHGKKKW